MCIIVGGCELTRNINKKNTLAFYEYKFLGKLSSFFLKK